MKFSIGDRVILIQTGEEGEITDYINKEMWEVEVKGIRFPVYVDDIDHPYLKWFTERNLGKKRKHVVHEQFPVESEKLRPQRLAKGIYLSFMPVYKPAEAEDIVDHLKIFLLNETPSAIRFSYNVKVLHQSDFRHEGSLHPFGHLYLHSIEYADMNDQPRFHWRLSDANPENKPEEGVLRIKPSRLFMHINDLLSRNEPTFSYLLVEDFFPKPKEKTEELQAPVIQAKAAKSPKITNLQDLPRYEVDLHIEQLVDNYRGLTNAEIMDMQLKTLERYLYLAIIHKQERMIIIHGLGTGTLKEAVHGVLKNMPEVKRYSNEWLGNYGFGATEVEFQY
jgi:hypothetical protein